MGWVGSSFVLIFLGVGGGGEISIVLAVTVFFFFFFIVGFRVPGVNR